MIQGSLNDSWSVCQQRRRQSLALLRRVTSKVAGHAFGSVRWSRHQQSRKANPSVDHCGHAAHNDKHPKSRERYPACGQATHGILPPLGSRGALQETIGRRGRSRGHLSENGSQSRSERTASIRWCAGLGHTSTICSLWNNGKEGMSSQSMS